MSLEERRLAGRGAGVMVCGCRRKLKCWLAWAFSSREGHQIEQGLHRPRSQEKLLLNGK